MPPESPATRRPPPLEKGSAAARFEERFREVVVTFQRRQALRGAGFGLVVGCVLAVAVALLGWWWREPSWRVGPLVAAPLGFAVAFVVARRRAFSAAQVALYVDAQLGTSELVSTAAELVRSDPRSPLSESVLQRAAELLGTARITAARPRVWTRLHAIAPVGLLLWGATQFIPARPPAPQPAPPPGARTVKAAQVPGLDRIVALEQLEGRTPEQRERLRALAERAKKLRERLAQGMEHREAQAELARLRDDIAAEHWKLGQQAERAALEAALGALEAEPGMKDASRALGNGDLVGFDEEMSSLARRLEEEDREAAREALKKAAEAARKQGGQALAELLDRQAEQLERRSRSAELLRELGSSLEQQLSEEGRRALDEFGKNGDPEAARRLMEALDQALEQLSEAERQRLVERMKKQLLDGDSEIDPLTKEQLEQLLRQLESPEGQRALRERLRQMSEPDADAQRERALDEAERGGAEAERSLGGVLPLPGPGAGNGPSPTPPQPGPGQPGEGGGQGDHSGNTEKRAGDGGFVARATPRLQPGLPLQAKTLGRAPARAGETAQKLGTEALGNMAPAELGAVERSDVPQDYREQVGRYFQP